MKKTVFILIIALMIPFVYGVSGCKKEAKTSYEIDCSLSKDNMLTGTEKVNFYNDTDKSFTELKFNLFGNAFRRGAKYSPIAEQYKKNAYYNGESFGEMEILSVKCGEENLKYSVCGEDENILSVQLKEEIFPEDTVSVSINYTMSLAEVVARTGVNAHTINLANFYPILCAIDDNGFYECLYYANGDPFYSECADYIVKLSCDSEYTVASSGSVIDSKTVGNITTNTYSLNNARSFCFVLSKDFESLTNISTGTTINYYYYDDENPSVSMEYAVKSIETFEKLFGEYPYDTYSVVQTEFIQGGMEFPTLVMISDDLEEKAYGEVIVHETAHQWWQTAVGNNEIEYGFLDEGLAEYSVVMFYENNPEYEYTRENLIKSSEQTYKIYCSVYDKLFGKVNTTMLRNLGEYTSEYEYVNIAYVKPCIMYDCLRKTIGDEKFVEGLKTYYKEYCFKIAEPQDLVGVYEKSGTDVNGFFDSFFNGKAII